MLGESGVDKACWVNTVKMPGNVGGILRIWVGLWLGSHGAWKKVDKGRAR